MGDTEEDTPIDSARSTRGNIGKSLKNASKRVTLNFMVKQLGCMTGHWMEITVRMDGRLLTWSPLQKAQLLKDLNGQKLIFHAISNGEAIGDSRTWWTFLKILLVEIMFCHLDGIVKRHHKFGMLVLISKLSR